MRIIDIKDMARYLGLSLLSKGLSVSPLKLQKILYYTQAWHMVFFGRESTLFEEKPEAWVNGPVYKDIYYEYKDKVPFMCDHLNISHFDTDNPERTMMELAEKMQLDNEETELIDSIVTLYGAMSQNKLIFLTHSEKPWVEKREGLKPFERSSEELSFDTMYQYYKDRHERNLAKR